MKGIDKILNVIGYDSINDFIHSTLFLKKEFVLLWVYGFSISGVFVVLNFIDCSVNNFIYNPSKGVYIFFAITLFDFGLGVAAAKLKKEQVTADKMLRGFIRFAVGIILTAIMFNMNSVWPIIIQNFIVDGLLIAFCLATLWSAVENANSLQLISKDIYDMLKSVTDLRKMINNYKNKKDNEPNA